MNFLDGDHNAYEDPEAEYALLDDDFSYSNSLTKERSVDNNSNINSDNNKVVVTDANRNSIDDILTDFMQATKMTDEHIDIEKEIDWLSPEIDRKFVIGSNSDNKTMVTEEEVDELEEDVKINDEENEEGEEENDQGEEKEEGSNCGTEQSSILHLQNGSLQ